MPKKVTLKVLADRLGLSKSAVSSVLNNAPLARSFTPETRERILKAAKQYNYKPNYFARYLNQQRSYLIGVISPDLAEGYGASVLGGIEEYLLQSDYGYFLASHEWSKSRIDRTIQMFLERGVDGLILINTSLSSPVDLPLVVIGKGNRIKTAISIAIDNHAGVRSALEHLVSLGHSKIAFIKGHKDSADTEDRWNGIVAAARSLSIKVDRKLVVQLERLGAQQISGIEEGAACAQTLMARGCKFTALMAFNDNSAIGAINHFRERGWRMPHDLSVVGFDDVAAARIVFPALTTVQQPLRLIGETAAHEVIDAITNGMKKRQLVFTPKLIIRNSTAPASSPTSKQA